MPVKTSELNTIREQIKEICRDFVDNEIGYLHDDLSEIMIRKLISVISFANEMKSQKTFDCKILCKQPIDISFQIVFPNGF